MRPHRAERTADGRDYVPSSGLLDFTGDIGYRPTRPEQHLALSRTALITPVGATFGEVAIFREQIGSRFRQNQNVGDKGGNSFPGGSTVPGPAGIPPDIPGSDPDELGR